MSGKTFFFKLKFRKVDPKFPLYPAAEIHARHGSYVYEKLTPEMTESEIDGYIDRLLSELEHIRQEGKRKFAGAKKNQPWQRV